MHSRILEDIMFNLTITITGMTLKQIITLEHKIITKQISKKIIINSIILTGDAK